jgi:hypothetical protein
MQQLPVNDSTAGETGKFELLYVKVRVQSFEAGGTGGWIRVSATADHSSLSHDRTTSMRCRKDWYGSKEEKINTCTQISTASSFVDDQRSDTLVFTTAGLSLATVSRHPLN